MEASATDGDATGGDAVVRPMALEEIDVRIDYFHDASEEYLTLMGVDLALMGSREDWRAISATAGDHTEDVPGLGLYGAVSSPEPSKGPADNQVL